MPTFHQIVIAPAQDEIVVVSHFQPSVPKASPHSGRGFFSQRNGLCRCFYTIALNVVANSDDEHIGDLI